MISSHYLNLSYFDSHFSNVLSFISIFQDIVEDWMKFLASSSYDYMKLMVMELQQKLSEIEEMEKIQQQQNSNACNHPNARSNPFNKNDTLNPGTQPKMSEFLQNSNWTQIHAKFGSRITNDRDKWCLSLLQN